MTLVPIYLVYGTLAVTVGLLLRETWRTSQAIPVDDHAAIEAAKLLKDWAAWMTTVSTGVIGAIGVMLSPAAVCPKAVPPPIPGPIREQLWAYWSVALLVLSIIFAAWVLGSLPSIVSRMKKDKASVHNDIYEVKFFSFIPIRFGVIAALQHVLFVLGLFCFALYVTYFPWSKVL